MLEIIVTAAIILGFVLNIFFVDHPDTTSYTAAFVLSLLVEGVILGLWWLWRKRRKLMPKTTRETEASHMPETIVTNGSDDGGLPP
jgi:membrane protein implicated in regulation of membrane protease activity